MPFVTEKIWLTMPHIGESIVVASYPVTHKEFENADAIKQMQALIELIRAVRGIRTDVNAPMANEIDIQVKLQDADLKPIFENNFEFINRFVHAKEFEVGTDLDTPALAASAVINGATIYVPLAELIDLDEEIAKLTKAEKKLDQEIARFEKKLGNQGFLAQAPAEVIDEQKAKLADAQAKLAGTQDRIKELQAAK